MNGGSNLGILYIKEKTQMNIFYLFSGYDGLFKHEC